MNPISKLTKRNKWTDELMRKRLMMKEGDGRVLRMSTGCRSERLGWVWIADMRDWIAIAHGRPG